MNYVTRLTACISLLFSIVSFASDATDQENMRVVKFVQEQAEKGGAFYQLTLGSYYEDGIGVEKNYELSTQWYRKAAEGGLGEAQFKLGGSYLTGQGVKKDPEEAVKWLRKASENGHANAQYLLGAAYAKGLGVEKNLANTAIWWRKAADQGNVHAQNDLAWLYSDGAGDGVEQDFSESAKWFLKASEQGNAKAQYFLGCCYALGKGVKKDKAEAARWYQKSAEQGYPAAQYNLGVAYANGEGEIKDYQDAYGWVLLAAAGGNDNASAILGDLEKMLSPSEQQASRSWAKKWKPQKKQVAETPRTGTLAETSPANPYSDISSSKITQSDKTASAHISLLNTVLMIGSIFVVCFIAILLWNRNRKKASTPSDTLKCTSTSHSPITPVNSSTDDEPLSKQVDDFNANPLVKMGIMKALPDCDCYPDATGSFGVSPTNPIPVNGHNGTFVYLSRLRSKSGVGFMWHRLGSEETPPYPKPIDVYELVAIDASEWRKLYFGIYHHRRSTMAPDGLTLLPWSQMKDIERVMAKTGFPGHNQKVENFPFGLPAIIEKSEMLNKIMPDLGKTMAKTAQKWINENKGKWGASYMPKV